MTTHKFTAVLNKKIEPGKAMNALAHMTAGLVGTYPNVPAMEIINYEDKDNGAHMASKHPFIILSAKNGNKIRTLRQEAIAKGVHFASFTSAMTVGTWEDQVKKSKETPEAELEYYGICLFGERAVLEEMTRSFSLWV
jgi:hypothetical protein